MDVRCERCSTEYEFDEDRITDAGVAVRCTHCDHVFMVKKVAVTAPMPAGTGSDSAAAWPSTRVPPKAPSDRPREWKVRQANGNLITFKELTTLQKWIVERKLNRDDEITLTGESWKRLGNIAELASFFQVVEEAQRASQLAQQLSGGARVMPPTEAPAAQSGRASSPDGSAPPVLVSLEEAIERTPASPRASAAPPGPSAMREFESFSFSKSAGPRTAGFEAGSAVGSRPIAPEPAFTLNPPSAAPAEQSDDALAAAAGLGKRRRGPWLAILFVLALGAVGYLAYRYFVWVPEQQKQAQMEAEAGASAARAEQERMERERAEQERAAQVRAAQREQERARVAARPPPEVSAPDASVREPSEPVAVGAGNPAPLVPEPLVQAPDAGAPKAVAKAEVPRNFDSYMNQGDRLREREQPRTALDAYAKAAEMEPNRAEPLAGRGLALLDLGRTVAAIAAFEDALKIDPRSGLALMGLAEANRAAGKKDEAIRYYQRYLEVLPDGSEAPVAKAAIRALQE
jgi:predicted Zn finger-like uncharacterized protein